MNVHTPHLSLRELQVLHLAAEGLTAKETAKLLHLSESAVNLYICHARHKLGAKTKAEAIAMMMETGEITRESIEGVKPMKGNKFAPHNGALQDMLVISNRLRHMLEVMLLAEVGQTTDNGDPAVWNELAEKFLKIAAQSCGYHITKAPVSRNVDASIGSPFERTRLGE